MPASPLANRLFSTWEFWINLQFLFLESFPKSSDHMWNKFSHCANQFCGQVPDMKSNKSQGWDWEKEVSMTACGEGQRRQDVDPEEKMLDQESGDLESNPSSALEFCSCRSHTPHLWASVSSHMSQEVRSCHDSLPLPMPMANIPNSISTLFSVEPRLHTATIKPLQLVQETKTSLQSPSFNLKSPLLFD